MADDMLAHRVSALRRRSFESSSIDSTDLAQQRRQNDLNLKGTLESIYAKYAQDFTEIGDEVNILTGEVIVDRGHVERMQSELDIGTGQPVRRYKSWINNLVKEEEEVEKGLELENDGEDEEYDEDEDELCSTPLRPIKARTRHERSIEIVDSTENGLYETADNNTSPVPGVIAASEAQMIPHHDSIHTRSVSSSAQPPLPVALEAFKASMAQQFQALVDSYFPSAAPVQTETNCTRPRQTPMPQTPQAILQTRSGKRSHSQFQERTHSEPRSAPSRGHLTIPTHSTGDRKKLRMWSPPGTESLWALHPSKAGRPRGSLNKKTLLKMGGHSSRTSPLQTSVAKGLVLHRERDDDDDELVVAGGFSGRSEQSRRESSLQSSQKSGHILPLDIRQPSSLLSVPDSEEDEPMDLIDLPTESEITEPITRSVPSRATTAHQEQIKSSGRTKSNGKRPKRLFRKSDMSLSDADEEEEEEEMAPHPQTNLVTSQELVHFSGGLRRKPRTMLTPAKSSTSPNTFKYDTPLPIARMDSSQNTTYSSGGRRKKPRALLIQGLPGSQKLSSPMPGPRPIDTSRIANPNRSEARLACSAKDSSRCAEEIKVAEVSAANANRLVNSSSPQNPANPLFDSPSTAQLQSSLHRAVAEARRGSTPSRARSAKEFGKSLDSLDVGVFHASSLPPRPHPAEQRPRQAHPLVRSTPEPSASQSDLVQDTRELNPPSYPATEAQGTPERRFEARRNVPDVCTDPPPVENPADTIPPAKTKRQWIRRRPWDPAEDERLIYLYNVEKLSWAKIHTGNYFPGFTYHNLVHHYYKVLGGPISQAKTRHGTCPPKECESCHEEYIPGKKLEALVSKRIRKSKKNKKNLCAKCEIDQRKRMSSGSVGLGQRA